MDYNFMGTPMLPGQQINAPGGPAYIPQPMPMYQPTPTVVAPMQKSYGFTVIPDNPDPATGTMLVPTANNLPDPDQPRRRGRPRKKDGTNPLDIIKADKAEVVNSSTIETYNQTSMMLEDTIQQVEMIAAELKHEFDAARSNRTLRNRAHVIMGLSEGLSKLLEAKISAIKELNSTISKANDLDYKKEKDRLAISQNAESDERHIMDLYSAFIKNNSATNNPITMMPSAISATVASSGGDGIIRSPLISANGGANNNEVVDIGYLNYLSRLTPEQNLMFYENDPNVQTVVVYDRSNGNKFFQVMNVATGQAIPNVPVLDQRFMDDTYLDLKSMTARNSNLNQTFPIVEINKNSVEAQY